MRRKLLFAYYQWRVAQLLDTLELHYDKLQCSVKMADGIYPEGPRIKEHIIHLYTKLKQNAPMNYNAPPLPDWVYR